MFELISAALRRKRPPTHALFDTVSMEFRVRLFDIAGTANNGRHARGLEQPGLGGEADLGRAVGAGQGLHHQYWLLRASSQGYCLNLQ